MGVSILVSKQLVVVVIHEIFGMSDWVEDVADQFAGAGYIALAPDLLSGMGHLRRKRCADRRHHPGNAGTDEGGRQRPTSR